MTNSIYKSFIQTKNGRTIPLLQNDRTIESKYNPEREASNLISSIAEHYAFFIVLGISSGSLIEALSEKYENAKIIGIEKNNEDLNYISQLDTIKELQQNKNIIMCSINDIEQVLINNYIPALYGPFRIIDQQAWTQYNKESIPLINQKINKAIEIISSDYSVQCHFGKIWQSNIINNLKLLSKRETQTLNKIDIRKTAVIIAAGPSLDEKISDLKINRDNYFIIATDTAFHTLNSHKIYSDIVVSIDGQHISHNHFMNVKNNTKTIYALDLCSDFSVTKYIIDKKLPLIFFKSGHPLSNYAEQFASKSFLALFSGAGTVTITAMDLALKLGFKNIKIYGGDFSYIDGKTYVSGTYFDTIFHTNESKITSAEEQFSKLMYRTELIPVNSNTYSTVMLNAYRNSLEGYLTNNNCSFEMKDNTYVIKVCNSKTKKCLLEPITFDYRAFIQSIKNNSAEQLILPLLPYIAWLRNKTHDKEEFVTLLKLAQSNIVIYN